MKNLPYLIALLFLSHSLFSEDVLNEVVYWELTRVDTKIEEKKFDEAEEILRRWYKKNWQLTLFFMKLESISKASNNSTQSGVGKEFLIISISLTVLLNLSVTFWFFIYIQQNGIDKFLIK